MRRRTTLGVIPMLGFALAGCKGSVSLDIKPREATPEEVSRAVSQLPSGFREGVAEPAKQLGTQVWAFDFKGGPFDCWIDIDEEGQQTALSPHSQNAKTRILCEGESGVLLFWFQPRTTPGMPQHLKERFLANTPQVPNLFVGLSSNGNNTLDMSQFDNPDKPIVPLWFGWKDADVRPQPKAATLKPGETACILLIEATEKGAEGNQKKVKLSLTVVK